MENRIRYRIWQYWKSLQSSPGEEDLNRIRLILAPFEMVQFLKLPVPDQNHSLRVYQYLESNGELDPDLLKAALLHDLGKTQHPLNRWERILAVILRSLFPTRSREWGSGSPPGLRRALVVIQQHPVWGAEMALSLGCNPRTVWLIRHHESDTSEIQGSEQDLILLRKLQGADNQN
jgi:putative nucleotidyltransferase with HDIG domain